jgi:hypothetical protein
VFGLTDLVVSQCMTGLTVVQHYAAMHGLTGDDILEGADPDGDGHTNEQEYFAGTNPNDPADRLAVTGLTVTPGGGASTVEWMSKSNKLYHAEYRDGFVDPSWHPLATVGATGTTTVTQDPTWTGAVGRLYRVRVEP